jgi:phosphate transport system substrate-binding protein
VQLPTRDILVVHRTDGSGTTYVFTDYLNSASTAWSSRVGMGKSVRWPTGLGGKGNEGVAGQVRQTPGAIGYVEQVYAQQNNLSVAGMRNRAGEFVLPTIEATVGGGQRGCRPAG